jgi:hypothetical protein
MNVIQAAIDSMKLANKDYMGEAGPVGYTHCQDMLKQMIEHQDDWSYGKLCRWLGWIQCCLVGSGCCDLQKVKDISRRNA